MGNFSLSAIRAQFLCVPWITGFKYGGNILVFKAAVSKSFHPMISASHSHLNVGQSSFSHFLTHPLSVSSDSYSSSVYISSKITATNINVSVSSCIFRFCGNISESGGGICCTNAGYLNVTDSSFQICQANVGGAIYGFMISTISMNRICVDRCYSVNHGFGIYVYSEGWTAVNYITDSLCTTSAASGDEGNLFGGSELTIGNFNVTKSSKGASSAVFLFIDFSTTMANATMMTIAGNSGTYGLCGLRYSSIAIDSSNFVNNSCGVHGLFELQSGTGHYISSSVICGNSCDMIVGDRPDIGSCLITFNDCTFDCAITSTNATVSFTNCKSASSPTTMRVSSTMVDNCIYISNQFSKDSSQSPRLYSRMIWGFILLS